MNKNYFSLNKYIYFQLKSLNIKKIDIINKLWINYYKHYFADSNYGYGNQGVIPTEFRDTKFSETNLWLADS